MKGYFLLLPMLFIFTGCSFHSLFQWENYQEVTNQYTIDNDLVAYRKGLEEVFNGDYNRYRWNGSRRASPPGIYAEYGLVYLAMNDKKTARKYFLLEKKAWPESSELMDKLISKTR